MKNLGKAFAGLTVCALLFFGCSKEDKAGAANSPANKATLSFGALLNNMAANKTALKGIIEDFPICSDSEPAYIEVILTGEENVGSAEDPSRIAISTTQDDPDGDGVLEYYTEYSTNLELTPGDYTLTHFVVLDSGNNILWVAPQTGRKFAGFVNKSLPFNFHLDAGVKKYIGMEVLCFDDRLVNLYGYNFSEIEHNKALEFCFFANYCDANGRHFPALISVDIWLGTDDSGTQIHSNLESIVENEGEPSAAPVCFPLPNPPEFSDEEDYIYYEVSLLDWNGVYGDVDNTVISGTLSREDITDNFVGENNLDYEHLFFGCDDTPPDNDCIDADKDCVPDDDDICPGSDDRLDTDEDGIPDGCDDIFEENETLKFCLFANFCDEIGRHYPGFISVNIWLGTDDSGTKIYTNKTNTVENAGEPSATPVCFDLPDLSQYEDDEDYLYYEVTVKDWSGVYGDVENKVITGTLSRKDITDNFDGENNVDYEHLFFGCDDAAGDGE